MAGGPAKRSRPAQGEIKRPRVDRFTALGIADVDHKDVSVLRTFISDRGKIRSRRVTGLTPQQQRRVAAAIKTAREMALLPYGKI
ncbi:30S ribosomal protein S18 [Mycolicibacterium diernhoferi]|uniref:Small ribosomal subunit protein bS18 n=1 Tax=Mycolicibacterium diernhoferi TaxID=1801 RepID=A0A1Q4HDM7_9MYCO|nr:30S ribosomal protein S18 [Mycolicibacterium diernhoferi]OJZ65626.1 30S ribosomal protein S18 [Mycolicibacterium diernhoferi]OPE55939.1 30S ribosomal protein S18 [Mycolicibacterium diernhoferi]PEG56000.1 30S ribosomal protein S18 [Mycolicibacterium diernhoferi]QYL22367.1 30S ribosomal protein S18 [Mycolicibacterium diernhoferi]